MTREDLATRVHKIIAEQLDVEPYRLKDDASYMDDLGADSLDAIELNMSIEEEFKLDIPDDEAENLRTVGRTIDYLARRLGVGEVAADSAEKCMACAVVFKPGDMVLDDVSGGTLHVACCGPEREGYVKDVGTGEPLGAGDPIPTGYAWAAE